MYDIAGKHLHSQASVARVAYIIYRWRFQKLYSYHRFYFFISIARYICLSFCNRSAIYASNKNAKSHVSSFALGYQYIPMHRDESHDVYDVKTGS